MLPSVVSIHHKGPAPSDQVGFDWHYREPPLTPNGGTPEASYADESSPTNYRLLIVIASQYRITPIPTFLVSSNSLHLELGSVTCEGVFPLLPIIPGDSIPLLFVPSSLSQASV